MTAQIIIQNHRLRVNKAPEGIRVTKAVVGTVSYTDDAKLLYEFNIESGDELGIDGVKKFVPYRFNVLGTKRWEKCYELQT